MMWKLFLISLFLIFLPGCSKDTDNESAEPSGPMAKFGSTPLIDGIFEEGEWDDATIVQVDSTQQFRIKHDNTNLYFAVGVAGGNFWLNSDTGLCVFHWSAQLGDAKYRKSDSSSLVLDKPFAFDLWELQNEPPTVIQERLAAYLTKNGWVANICPMGSLVQSELAISFNRLGVKTGASRFVEIPGVHIGGGLMISRNDPRVEEIKALSREELKRQFPRLSWPSKSVPNDSLSMGESPETINIDPADFGTIWIDLQI